MRKQHKKLRRSAIALTAVIMIMTQLAPTASAYETPDQLIPLGYTVGIHLETEGVLILGYVPVMTDDGEISPAQQNGLLAGDQIIVLEDEKWPTVKSLSEVLERSQGKELRLTVKRDGQEKKITMKPAQGDDGRYRIGAWVRDSMAGIGTMTFFDPNTGLFGALGHGVSDSETARLIPLKTGEIMDSDIQSVTKSEAGRPGELCGDFSPEEPLGSIVLNTESGIFGIIDSENVERQLVPVPVTRAGDVHEGPAKILANVAGDEVRSYDIEIVKVFEGGDNTNRNFVLRVTDPALIAQTGGIVQGMSGSPVIQDGCLLGAVTHVLINDPRRGYGIFIENMYRNGESIVSLNAA